MCATSSRPGCSSCARRLRAGHGIHAGDADVDADGHAADANDSSYDYDDNDDDDDDDDDAMLCF